MFVKPAVLEAAKFPATDNVLVTFTMPTVELPNTAPGPTIVPVKLPPASKR